MAYNPDAGLSHVQVYPDGPARNDQNYTFATIPLHTTLNAFEDLTFAKDTDLTDGSINATFNTLTANVNIETPTIHASSNGMGNNFRVGDDAFIGDINKTNTIVVAGVVNGDRGFIQFGSGSQPSIGHNGGGGFPPAGTATSGSILTTSGHLYFYNGTSGNGGWAQII